MLLDRANGSCTSNGFGAGAPYTGCWADLYAASSYKLLRVRESNPPAWHSMVKIWQTAQVREIYVILIIHYGPSRHLLCFLSDTVALNINIWTLLVSEKEYVHRSNVLKILKSRYKQSNYLYPSNPACKANLSVETTVD